MTDYRQVDVKIRRFMVQVTIPRHSDTALTRINADDTYIARNGDTYIARNGDTYVAYNYTQNVYAPIINVRKRKFVVNADVSHD